MCYWSGIDVLLEWYRCTTGVIDAVLTWSDNYYSGGIFQHIYIIIINYA